MSINDRRGIYTCMQIFMFYMKFRNLIVSFKMTSWAISVSVTLIVLYFADAVPTGDCHFSTLKYKNGDVFTLPDTGPCFKFKCMGGHVRPYEEKCLHPFDNSCMEKGENFTDPNACLVVGCITPFELTFLQLLCKDDAGKCYNNGDTVAKHHEGKQINCTCSSVGFDVSLLCPEE